MANEKPQRELLTFLDWHPEDMKDAKDGAITLASLGQPGQWLGVAKMIAYSGVSKQTLENLANQGLVGKQKRKGGLAYSLDDMDRYIANILLPGYNALLFCAIRKAQFFLDRHDTGAAHLARYKEWARRFLALPVHPYHINIKDARNADDKQLQETTGKGNDAQAGA